MKEYPRNKLGIRILDDPKQRHKTSDWDCLKHGHHGPRTGKSITEEDNFMMGGYYIFQRICTYCGKYFWSEK
jgi:hypothetical protein